MAYLKTLEFDGLATAAFLLEPDKIMNMMYSSDKPSAEKIKRGSHHGAKLVTLPQCAFDDHDNAFATWQVGPIIAPSTICGARVYVFGPLGVSDNAL